MSPFIQQCLSRNVLKSLVKSGLALDYNKALGNVTALYRSAVGPSSGEVQIPLPQAEKPRVRPDELTDVDIEQAILPLFDYFDANLQTLNTNLSDTAKEIVMSRVWKEILTIFEGLLVPPLSEVGSDMKPLSDKEVDIVFKWLKVTSTGISYIMLELTSPVSSCEITPMQTEKGQCHLRFCRIRNIGISSLYDYITIGPRTLPWILLINVTDDSCSDALMEECVRMMQQTFGVAPSVKRRAKSVYQQRNLGTIKERKKEKRKEKEVIGAETIMRILRMRYVRSTTRCYPCL